MKKKGLIKKTHYQHQNGMSLVIVLIILTISMLLGISAIELSMMGERAARNERDYQIAWQASESALTDAEFDIDPKETGTSERSAIFTSDNSIAFEDGCGTSGNSHGLCLAADTGKPTWLSIDFDKSNTPSVAYGTFTKRTFDFGNSGLKPKKSPRYIIELLEDTASRGDASINSEKKFVYRITSIGYGPREDIQAITQSIYRK